jgi:sugar/nucleoside kinase (ribokinase family)
VGFPEKRWGGGTRAVDYLLVGHVCVDETPDGPRLGGTAAYAAVLAHALGLRVGLVTSVAADVDLAASLPSVAAFVVPSRESTRFRNVSCAGQRQQALLARAVPLTLEAIPVPWRAAPLVHLAPVADEVDVAIVAALRPAVGFLGATPQGWLRAWDAAGPVRQRPWGPLAAALQPLDALVVSDEDLAGEPAGVAPLVGAGRCVARTRGAGGVQVYEGEAVCDLPAFPATVADETGAGDVFAAAWFVRLAAGDSAVGAARFAAAAAACAVERSGPYAAPTAAEIEERSG